MAEPTPERTCVVPPLHEAPLSDLALPSDVGPTTFLVGGEAAPSPTVVRDYGRYRLVRSHAEGGLGRVSLAEDATLGRTVALKEIRPDHPSPDSAIARFRNEAAITGQLEHPGIVPVYTLDEHPDGQPYYAMRFIQGRTLTDAILEYHVTPSPLVFRELLQRFVSICQTLAYAHSKGVIHRDLKPDNIMLGDYGETLVVDWGLAKQLQSEECRLQNDASGTDGSTDDPSAIDKRQAELTQAGEVVGTPAFMAPEQACADQGRTGPVSDVYALGALLYSLLTGHPPFTGNTMQVIHLLQRGAKPVPVRTRNPEVPLPLAAVCAKAMALIPADRYGSALELGHDIERWLADEPVTAWPEPRRVRLRRWLRRHRTLAVGIAATLLVLWLAALALVGVVQHFTQQSLEQAQAAEAVVRREHDQKEKERQRAEAALAGTRAINAFLREEVLRSARPRGVAGGLGRSATLRQALDAATPKIDRLFAGQPLLEADVCHELGHTYYLLGVPDQALKLLGRAVALRQKHLGDVHRDTLESQNFLGLALVAAGQLQAAQQLLEATEAALHRQYGPEHPETLGLLENVAAALTHRGLYDQAAAKLRQVADAHRRLSGPDHPDTLDALGKLGTVLLELGRFAEAETLLRQAHEGQVRRYGAGHAETFDGLAVLGLLHQQRGRLREAEPLLRQALEGRRDVQGPEHPDTLATQNSYANLLTLLGRRKEAEPLLRQTLAAQARVLGAEHPSVLTTRNNLAGVLAELGRQAEAEALLREAWLQQQRQLGPEHPDTLTTQHNLAVMVHRLGRVSEAEQMQRQLLEIQRRVLGPEHPDTLTTLHNQATALITDDRHKGAEVLLRQVWTLRKRILGPDHPDTLTTQGNLACTLRDLRRHAEAEPLYADAVERQKAHLDADHPSRLHLEGQYGIHLYERNKLGDAEPLLRRVLEAQRRVLGPESPDTLSCQNYLAQVCRFTGQLEEAEALLRPLPAAMRRVYGQDHPHAWAVDVNLANVLKQHGKHAEAEPLYRQAWPSFRRQFGPAHRDTLEVQASFAEALVALKKFTEAEPLLLEHHRLLEQNKAPTKALKRATEGIVKLYEAWGQPEKAAAWRKKLEPSEVRKGPFLTP